MTGICNQSAPGEGPIIIVGGCGFIGSNLAHAILQSGRRVAVIDNMSRAGVEQNLAWLKGQHGERLEARIGDIRDRAFLADAFAGATSVFHFAAQTAVTTSLDDPFDDFEVNAFGTLNVLETVRAMKRPVPVIFASTNKVYGRLDEFEIVSKDGRYEPVDDTSRLYGFSEDCVLSFSTPYGCSKGVADQYVLDYARSYGLPTAVLRMSCIYGQRQFGTEDQGWVAHFAMRALQGAPIAIYGDGLQVRDILHVDDAVAAYCAVLDNIEDVRGRSFNLGGGPGNAVSLKMVIDEISELTGRKPAVEFRNWRMGDQLYFVSDTRALQQVLAWKPSIGWREGVGRLTHWLAENRFSRDMAGRKALADRRVEA